MLLRYIGGNFNEASSYLENTVPVNGDDVIVLSSATNGYLSSNLPISGQLRSFIVENGYNGLINFNGFKLKLFSVGFNGVALDLNNGNYIDTQNNGGIELTLRANASNINYCRVKMNNETLQNINIFIVNSNAYLTLDDSIYCKNLISTNNAYFYNTISNLSINIYGNLFIQGVTAEASSDYLGQFFGFNHFCNVNLNGNENYIYGCARAMSSGISFSINGNYILSNNFTYHLINNYAYENNFLINGYLSSNILNKCYIILSKTGYLSTPNKIKLNGDKFVILSPFNSIIKLEDSYINDYLITQGIYYGDNINNYSIRSAYNDRNALINFSENGRLYSINTSFKDISLSKPQTVVNCKIFNCVNILNKNGYDNLIIG